MATLFSVEEVAQAISVDVRAVRSWASENGVCRIGPVWVFTTDDVKRIAADLADEESDDEPVNEPVAGSTTNEENDSSLKASFIGQIVHYVDSTYVGGRKTKDVGRHCAAIVLAVNGDDVDLHVFIHEYSGITDGKTCRQEFDVEHSNEPNVHTWHFAEQCTES